MGLVNNMAFMCDVRTPPSPVLLLLRRCFVTAPPLSHRSEIPAHSARPPFLVALQEAAVFDEDISLWDVSKVTTMQQMFRVRAPSSSELLLL